MRRDHGPPRRVLEVGPHASAALSTPAPASPAPTGAQPAGRAAAALRPRLWNDRSRLTAEFVAFFILFPTLPVLGLLPLTIIPVLVLAGVLCAVILLCDRTFHRRQLGLGEPGVHRVAFRRILTWFLIGSAVMAAGVILFDRDALFRLVRTRPEVWAIIMVGYPVFSVYPQELIFRTFLFHRYAVVFPSRLAMIAASALTFGYVHIVMGNWVAMVLSTVGGFLFAYTYDRTRSTLLCTLEHALYGCFIFTIGLGSYFYHGTMRAAEAAAGMP